MPRNDLLQWRRLVGRILGEALHALILSHGLLMAFALVLNGFDPMATARFVHNALDRMIEAEPMRQARFQAVFAGAVLATAALVLVVRFVDRCSAKGRSAA